MSDSKNWSEFWNDRWQQNQIGFHQDEFEFFLAKFNPEIKPGALVLVPLCGKTKDMLYFAHRGQKVLGVELSELACETFFKENALTYTLETVDSFKVFKGEQIQIYCGDFFKLKPSHLSGLGLIYDRACLIALPEELRLRYVNHLIHLTETIHSSEFKMFLIALCYDQSLKKGPPFSVSNDEVTKLYDEHFKISVLERHAETVGGDLPAEESAYIMSKR